VPDWEFAYVIAVTAVLTVAVLLTRAWDDHERRRRDDR
jgi:hypothetical protein